MKDHTDPKKQLEKIGEEKERIYQLKKKWETGGLTPGWWAHTGLPHLKKLETEERKIRCFIQRKDQNISGKKDIPSPENNQKDPLQEAVITAPVSDRILVDAGPGTGKTTVACRRVAHLINKQQVYPANILLISFTRAAVHEIRQRIGDYLEDKEKKYSVKITTIDSYAYEIIRGYNERYHFTGSYNDSIAEALRLIKEDDATMEIFEKIEHLIIDESQDVLGIRADFLISFIGNLQKKCGVTVFSDNAQAIYDWIAERDNNSRFMQNKNPLSFRINQELPHMFRTEFLKTIHRTNDPSLKFIFSETRDVVLNRSIDPGLKMRKVMEQIREKAHGKVDSIEKQPVADCENCFILYRSNREILYASAQLKKTPHRIRMRGLPYCIHPWIGACLSEYTDRTLDRHTFMDLWEEKTKNLQSVGTDAESAWNLLLKVAADTQGNLVSMKQLRAGLWHAHPPDIFCTKEIGPGGAIISTIHSSKGREAEEVRLMLPKYSKNGKYERSDEETRVLFVGATRASGNLKIGKGIRYYPISHLPPYNRIYTPIASRRSARIQIGCENDISAKDLGRTMSEDQIRRAQNTMLAMSGKITSAKMERVKNSEFHYRLKSEEGTVLAEITEGPLKEDFDRIISVVEEKSHSSGLDFPAVINDLRIFGIRTLILKPDSPECTALKYPWNESGIMLAPVVVGWPEIVFPKNEGSRISGGVIKI